MNDFFIGLQFLTRIRIVRQTEWTEESFGHSVRYFTLIGAVIGAILAAVVFLAGLYMPSLLEKHSFLLAIVILWILLTGGLHCDGFMDTMDGVFSGRSPERMLEIMKDSRVGSNGVVAFAVLILGKWSVLMDLPTAQLLAALFVAPVIGRVAMTMAITFFPYARPEGLGKAFAKYATKKTFALNLAVALIACALSNAAALVVMAAAVLIAYRFLKTVQSKIGGVTGDVYGAVTELTELTVLFLFLFV